MGSVSLPLWVQVLQALAVPVIAAVGAWVALQQMYIARVKLQHDLYDRRYAVFEAVRRFLNEAVSQKIVSSETFHPFVLGTADAQFLFDDGLAAYLKDMREHAAMARSIYLTMQSIPEGAPQKAAASKAAGEHVSWLVNQIDRLTEKFRPFLTLDRRSRSPLHFFFLNMRRGLLRLWLVVSVVWVLVIGINGWAQLLEIFETIEPPTGKGAVALAPGPYACWVTRHPENPFAFMDSGPKSLTEAWRQCMAYKMHLPVNALAPPLALLVLGYVGAWVTKGFSRGI